MDRPLEQIWEQKTAKKDPVHSEKDHVKQVERNQV